MPWARTDWTSEPLKFQDLCRDFGINRKTGYKWVRRHEVGGASALNGRSRPGHPMAAEKCRPCARSVLRAG